MSNPILHIAQATFAAAAILIGESVTNLDWTSTIERLGLAVVLVMFFIVTSWMREKRMAKRIDTLEKQVVSISSKLATQTETTTAMVKRENEALQKAIDTLSKRPCFAFANREEFDDWISWKQARESTS